MKGSLHCFEQTFVHERGLARTRHSRDARHQSERNLQIDVFQIVLSGIPQLEHLWAGCPPLFRHRDL